jgi:lactate dehydrogenase-like 2-hydroxyacid dehydrogenase
VKRAVLVLIPLPSSLLEQLSATYEVTVSIQGSGRFDSASLARVEAAVTNGTTGIAANQIESLPNLSLICCYGAGYENVDLRLAERRGITVSHAPGLNDHTVADHALALALALARDLVARDAAVRDGRWKDSRSPRPTLHGAAVGIIGMGRIGRLIAQRAAAFDTTIRYHSRMPKPELPWAFQENLVLMARKSEFLFAACPGGEETTHLINSEVLEALGSDGFLVNIARGSVVDTAALRYALKHGIIAGAGIDVLEGEPVVPPELRVLRNVIMTPHMAGRSPASVKAQADALMTSLARHFGGLYPSSMVARGSSARSGQQGKGTRPC